MANTKTPAHIAAAAALFVADAPDNLAALVAAMSVLDPMVPADA